MFTLYRGRDIERELKPEDFSYICSPQHALEQSKTHYDLDERNYRSGYKPFDVPERLYSQSPTWQRAQSGYADPIYDEVKYNLELGWLIGIDPRALWHWYDNPFRVDENGDLVCDRSDVYHEWYIRQVMNAYEYAVAERNGVKAAPTQREHYGNASVSPDQHAQATKMLNSKAAGRLLAAGGVYNGNIEDYAKTAQQLGGDAPAGYDQVLNETTAGSVIAVASIGAAFGLGRLGSMQEISQLEKINPNLHVLGKVNGEYSAINPGPLHQDIANTFTGGVYKEIQLSGDTTFYRAGVAGRPFGQYFSYEAPQSVLQARIDKALLPVWPNGSHSPLDSFYEISIPSSTKVYVGETGYQSGFYLGGTEQVVIPKPWDIPGVKILGNGGLK